MKTAISATFASLSLLAAAPAVAQESDGPIVITDGTGYIETTVTRPGVAGAGSSGSGGAVAGPLASEASSGSTGSGGDGGGSPCVTRPSSPEQAASLGVSGGAPGTGSFYYRRCPDGTAGVVWAPNGGGAPGGAGALVGVPVVTPAQLALEARDQLPLTAPTVRRSPDETGEYEGSPFTWVNLWTYFWTEPADFQPLTQTVSVGAVSATVVATPVGLVFEPGDGGEAVTCAGPGEAWTESDADDPPASGCGYQFRHVTEGEVDSQLAINWQVTWTGTGGTGGALPAMQTSTPAPLRVLQVQVVNK